MTVTGDLLENPRVQGQENRLWGTRLGVVGVGQEAWGGTRETKTICTSGPAKPTAEAEGTAHQPAPGPAGSCQVTFWSLGPRASRKPDVNPPSHSGSALGAEIRRPGDRDKRSGLPGCQLPRPTIPPRDPSSHSPGCRPQPLRRQWRRDSAQH